MRRIRVLLGEMHALQHEIVKGHLAGARDVDVFDRADFPTLADAVTETAPHVVVVQVAGELPAPYRELLDSAGHPRVLALEAAGRGSSLYVGGEQRLRIADVGPQKLVAVIRGAATGSEAAP